MKKLNHKTWPTARQEVVRVLTEEYECKLTDICRLVLSSNEGLTYHIFAEDYIHELTVLEDGYGLLGIMTLKDILDSRHIYGIQHTAYEMKRMEGAFIWTEPITEASEN